jgi:zinc/manganese transport system substrate-binding protein
LHDLKLPLALVLSLAAAPAVAAEVNAVASFSILGDMIARVGGDRIAVTTLVGPDADSHVYQPKPSDAVAIAGADIFFVNGLGFEGWMDRLVEATGYAGPLVAVSDGIAARETADHEDHDNHGDEEHDHGTTDPHAWQNAANGAVYARNIANGLCAVDAAGCDSHTANAEAYADELEALHTEIKDRLAAVPEAQRRVITNHDAFGYFGDAYGVTFLAPEGISTDAEPSAADVAKLIIQIKSEGVSAIFIENMTDRRLLQQIADETGVARGGELYSDALSAADGPAATYVEMLRHNVDLLIPAMEGK